MNRPAGEPSLGRRPGRARVGLADRIAALPLRTRMLIAMIAMLAAVCLVVGSISLLLLRGFLISQLDVQVDSVGQRFASSYGHKSCDDDDRPGPPCFLLSPGQRFGTVAARIVDGDVRQAGVLTSDGNPHDVGRHEKYDLRNVPTDGQTYTHHVGDLGDYRLLAVDRPDKHAVFVVGLPMDEVNTTLVRLGWIELVVAACGLVLAGAASTLIVRVTLRPLRRVAATAGRVAQLRLDRGEVALAERVPMRDTDVRTEVGQVGAALNQMLEHVAGALEARQASETQLRQFLADASHELRTPLAAIRGYTELALRSNSGSEPTQVPADVAHALRRVSAQAERMTSLVEDMLLLARLDAGRPLAAEPVDVSRLVVDAVSDAHAAGPDHRWLLRLPEQAVVVVGDAARLAQVWANLLANARVHTPAGTTVSAALEVEGGFAVVRVSDDGPGIAPALLPHVFGRFARGDSSRSRAAGSTGLGLAIAHAVVTAHGGQIWVDSVPGNTVFTVRLPLAGVPREPRPLPATNQPSAPPAMPPRARPPRRSLTRPPARSSARPTIPLNGPEPYSAPGPARGNGASPAPVRPEPDGPNGVVPTSTDVTATPSAHPGNPHAPTEFGSSAG